MGGFCSSWFSTFYKTFFGIFHNRKVLLKKSHALTFRVPSGTSRVSPAPWESRKRACPTHRTWWTQDSATRTVEAQWVVNKIFPFLYFSFLSLSRWCALWTPSAYSEAEETSDSFFTFLPPRKLDPHPARSHTAPEPRRRYPRRLVFPCPRLRQIQEVSLLIW